VIALVLSTYTVRIHGSHKVPVNPMV